MFSGRDPCNAGKQLVVRKVVILGLIVPSFTISLTVQGNTVLLGPISSTVL